MAHVLTMPPSEFDALLEAIAGVGARVDGLRSDVFRALSKHDERIRNLEIARSTSEAVRADRAERQRDAGLSLRWRAGIAITIGFSALGGALELIKLLGPR